MCGMNWFQSRIKKFLFKYSEKTLKMTTGWAGDLLGAVREIYKIIFNSYEMLLSVNEGFLTTNMSEVYICC